MTGRPRWQGHAAQSSAGSDDGAGASAAALGIVLPLCHFTETQLLYKIRKSVLILIIPNILTVHHMHTPPVFSMEVQTQHLLIGTFYMAKICCLTYRTLSLSCVLSFPDAGQDPLQLHLSCACVWNTIFHNMHMEIHFE